MRQISKKMKLIIFLVILIIVVGTAGFYFSKAFQIRRNQLPPMAKVEEKSNTNLNNTENLATSSSKSKIVLGEYYYKDNGDIYFDDGAGSWKIDNVDPSSFKVIDEQSEYSTDKNNVYYRGLILTKADTKTFKKLEGEKCSSAYADYYVDKNNIYYYNEVLSSDPASFSCLGDGWTKDKDDYYFAGALASFNYQDKMIYFEDLVGEGHEPGLGGTDTNTYILDKKTGDKKKIFNFGRSGPGGASLPAIAKTNYPNILEFTYSMVDGCGGYQEIWYYNILNNKILKIEDFGGCGFTTNSFTINDGPSIKELVDYQGCSRCTDSCENLKPTLKDVLVDDLPQKILTKEEVLKCENVDFWDANASLDLAGVKADFSQVYFTLSIGQWNDRENKNLILKVHQLSYNVLEKKAVIVYALPDLLTTTQIREQTDN